MISSLPCYCNKCYFQISLNFEVCPIEDSGLCHQTSSHGCCLKGSIPLIIISVSGRALMGTKPFPLSWYCFPLLCYLSQCCALCGDCTIMMSSINKGHAHRRVCVCVWEGGAINLTWTAWINVNSWVTGLHKRTSLYQTWIVSGMPELKPARMMKIPGNLWHRSR